MKINKILTLLILVSTVLFPGNLFAQLSAKWFTNSLNVEVGDSIKIDLFIDPSADHPVFTVSNTLNYDNNKIKFVDANFPEGWVVISKEPHSITDESNGFIRRTAGLPNGVFGNTKYMTYEFRAVSPGIAELYIEDGTVLDQENNDLGFQKKKMQISISEKTVLPVTESSDQVAEKEEVVDTQIANLRFNIFGKTAVRQGDDYLLTIFKDTGINKDKSSTVDIFVRDETGKNVFTAQKTFSESGPESIDIVVPKIVLEEGDYSIQTRTKFEGEYGFVLSEKEIGVLSSDRDWFDRNRSEILVSFFLLIVIATIYHIHRDHQIFRRLRNRAKR